MRLSDFPAYVLVALVIALAGVWFLGIQPSQIEHSLGFTLSP